MNDRETRYWIAVLAKEQVDAAVAGGYLEINQGKAGPLERMSAGDGVACYSPRLQYPDGEPLQAFTALGSVDGTPVYQARDGYQPFRRAVAWTPAHCAPVRPLLDRLGFIRNKSHWGAAFRFGYLRVPPEDFACIAAAMQADLSAGADDAPAAPGPRRRRAAATAGSTP